MDVGGTLWPDRVTAPVSDATCLERLSRLLPGIDATKVLAALRDELRQDDGALVQDTHGLLARALRTLCPNSTEMDVVAIRRALCVPAVPGIRLFPGATELLEGLRAFGLR
jgi:hypothetical protein